MEDVVENAFVVWTEDYTNQVKFWKETPLPEDVAEKMIPVLEELSKFPHIEYVAQVVERYHDKEKLEKRIGNLEKFRSFNLPESSAPVQDAARMVEDAQHDSVVVNIIQIKPSSLPDRESRLGTKRVQLMFRGKPYLRVLTEEEIKERKIQAGG